MALVISEHVCSLMPAEFTIGQFLRVSVAISAGSRSNGIRFVKNHAVIVDGISLVLFWSMC